MDEVITTAKSARERILNRAFSVRDIETPFWPELDGQLCLRAMSAQDVTDFQQLVGSVKAIGKAIQESLYLRGADGKHGERVFEPGDRDAISAQVEAGILEPLLQEIFKLNNMKMTAVEDAKKN